MIWCYGAHLEKHGFKGHGKKWEMDWVGAWERNVVKVSWKHSIIFLFCHGLGSTLYASILLYAMVPSHCIWDFPVMFACLASYFLDMCWKRCIWSAFPGLIFRSIWSRGSLLIVLSIKTSCRVVSWVLRASSLELLWRGREKQSLLFQSSLHRGGHFRYSWKLPQGEVIIDQREAGKKKRIFSNRCFIF